MRKSLLLLSLILVTSGCGLNGRSLSSVVRGEYVVKVIKSPGNEITYGAANEPTNNLKTATMSAVLKKADVTITTAMHGQTEAVTQLAGVIATSSKAWNLYINQQKINYTRLDDVTVKPSDSIEWRYEENK